MAPARKAKSGQATSPESEAKAEDKVPFVEIPLGVSAVLPADDLEGTLIPTVNLVFDPAPADVRSALATPSALTLNWPITGKAANLHDLSLPAQLAWLVYGADGTTVVRTVPAPGSAVAKIDGGGRFELLIGNTQPVLDFIAVGLVGNGKVGFSVALASPPGAAVQTATEKLTYNLGCTVQVKTKPESGLHLGDQATYSMPALHDLLKRIPLRFCVVEQDAKDGKGTGDKVALQREYSQGGMRSVDWTIGFADAEGSWAKFSYSEDFEEGDFEYGWELFAKAPTTGEWVRVLCSDAPLKVAKPTLKQFYIHADEPAKGKWSLAGEISGFGEHGPRVRIALGLVDSGHQHYPADLSRSPQVVLASSGAFATSMSGPIIAPSPDGSVAPLSVFGVLSLVPTWDNKGAQNPISGFLSFDQETFALFDPKGTTSWDTGCAWIASQEFKDVAPRGPKPREGGVHIPAPGPEAGGDPYSPLTFEEIAADLVAWEGEVSHLYLDSKGFMTIGIGTCLVTKEHPKDPTQTLALPFYYRGTDNKAEAKDIREVFNKVVAMPAKLPSTNYQTRPDLELKPADIRALVRDFIDNKALKALTRNFPDFNTFPKCARRAMVDIAYNAGAGFFNDSTPKVPAKAPKMRAAILAQDWKKASAEVPVKGRAERKQWRQELFDYAQTLKDRKQERTS
jgi:GH24 family phage-related lysozyme (muramidase)